MQNSLWAASCTPPTFPRLEGGHKTDVLVIGGGMAGVLTAHMLTEAGADCMLIEADEILSGVTRNTTAKITSQHGLIYAKLCRRFGEKAARLYWEANERALEDYRRLAREIPCDFERRDAYVYSVDRPQKLEEEMAALGALNIPAELGNVPDLPFDTAGAVRFRDQAQFHPLKFASGLARGLRIYEHTAARAFKGNTVITDRARIQAENIVVATHFPMLNKHGAYPLKLYQSRSYVLALEGAPPLEGMYLDEAEEGLSFRRHGPLTLLGGGSHRTGKPGGGWQVLERFAAAHYPGAGERYRWATQDCMTLDGMPYIGRYGRGTTGLFVATGFNKWGMTGSMLSARLLTDMLQGRENPAAQLFSPARGMLHPQLAANAFEAVCSLLTVRGPRCPHMGCALNWNAQEHSWDCPCHGSRFSRDGMLLDNPSTAGIRPREGRE